MLEMLAEVLGAEFTPRMREVWTTFYTFLAGAMQRGGPG